jgi:hypothetical protein
MKIAYALNYLVFFILTALSHFLEIVVMAETL